MCSSVRNCYTLFQNACTILHFLQQGTNHTVSLQYQYYHYLNKLYLFIFFIVFLLCIPLMAIDIKYLFMCIFTTHVFSSVKCLFLCPRFFFFGCTGSLLLLRLFSSDGEWGPLSSCGVQASHCGGFSCGAQALECVGFFSFSTWAQQLWCIGLVAPLHVRSSGTWDQTHVSCIGRWILYH